MTIQKREQMIKKLLYQSCNRGCKETDIIIGEFAKKNLDKMTDTEINELQVGDYIIWPNDPDPAPYKLEKINKNSWVCHGHTIRVQLKEGLLCDENGILIKRVKSYDIY